MECTWDNTHLQLNYDILSKLPPETVNTLKHGSNTQYLDTLAVLALDPEWTVTVFSTHESLFVEICNRWLSSVPPQVEPLSIAAALARILPFAPHLSLYAEEVLFRRPGGPLDLCLKIGVIGVSSLPDATLTSLLLTLTRLLQFDNTSFATAVSPALMQLLLSHPQLSIRYLAIGLLCSYLHANDVVFVEMVEKYIGKDEVSGEWEDKTIDYTFFSLWEEKRLANLHAVLSRCREARHYAQEDVVLCRTMISDDLSTSTACVAGVLLPRLGEKPRTSSTLVMTEATSHNMRQVAEAINSSRSILVAGLLGGGKSSIIRDIARALGKEDSMLTLHLNEQTDAKLLLGLYTSAGAPGTFSWQPGVLTTAVREGRWVLIEDLDRAPTEVISTLTPLLERGELLVPNLGGCIRAMRGFKLFATIRSTLNTKQEMMTPAIASLGSRNWCQVSLKILSDHDLKEIISTKFPILQAYQPMLMNVYHRIGSKNDYSHGDKRPVQHSTRFAAPQELLRCCHRLQTLLSSAGITDVNEPITGTVIDDMFMEVVDCFAASTQSREIRAAVIENIAQEMHVSDERAKYCMYTRTPVYENSSTTIRIGRATLPKAHKSRLTQLQRRQNKKRPFAMTKHALSISESIGIAVKEKEPYLLVGETGTGKTTIIQELAESLGHNLVVANLSQQSEAGDLLGGYKPVNMRALAIPMKEEFDDLFEETKFSSSKNQRYLKSVGRTIANGEWGRTIVLWKEAIKMVETALKPSIPPMLDKDGSQPKKRRKIDTPRFQELKLKWDAFASRVELFQKHLSGGSKGFAFSFAEGNIVKAVRNGDWVLLDEINLASPDTLESLAGLLSNGVNNAPSLLLSETGSVVEVVAHPDFRIFGAMNPATDVGKRDLPVSLRSRFTEYYIGSPDNDFESLVSIVNAYLRDYGHNDVQAAHDVANLYLTIRSFDESNRLVDGAGQKPHFSLRTLTRTMTYVTDIAPTYGLRRGLFEGFAMSFLTLLNEESKALIRPYIEKHLLGSLKNRRSLLNQVPRCPEDGKRYIQFRHYWMGQGLHPVQEQSHYIITPFVEQNLLNLVRATSTRRFPVLLQGPTSSGKTSMVEYLAKLSGNMFVRVNNHEHTDLQEYLGSYVSGPGGELQYQEGILVRALREGHWIVLDELNLAPSDILEALNRLLDDNRELFLPETQEVVRPHENFMLFATQNPPGLYGGRKILSRAFRNRFLELHFDDIPEDELETILRERSQIAPSFCTRIVAVYRKLILLRQSGRLFEQSQSYANLRDLFRWALRNADDREQLATNGFMLLGERVRKSDDRLEVKRIIEEVMKVRIDEALLYGTINLQAVESKKTTGSPAQIVWTKSMRRLYLLIVRALENNEPVLLVGNTGCGKTTMCQVIAESMHKKLYMINAHQNTETGDLIGAQRPLRNRSAIESQLLHDLSTIIDGHTVNNPELQNDISSLLYAYQALSSEQLNSYPLELRKRIDRGITRMKSLFEWSDGSLVHAMKAGQHFLLDEISLADDSVLERLNSVLESSRMLFLAEKGSDDAMVVASDGFQFLATMNPGGDYGKRELSPALRNRFTEIWVPPLSDEDDILEIVQAKLSPSMVHFARAIVDFAVWYIATFNESESSVSLREVLTWVEFLNLSRLSDPYAALLHGAAMVYIDGLGANPAAKLSTFSKTSFQERRNCLEKLSQLFQHDMISIYDTKSMLSADNMQLKVGPFKIEKSCDSGLAADFSLTADTTANNAMRIVRALQLNKPVLLEGSPGSGKTSLVTALAHAVGMPLTRINLSEQTDIMDLFGSDVPLEGGTAGQFAWRDAPFLQAMQRGEWVLLDEMNLASQSVLEGLNACLDHRGEVYIPELDQSFSRHPRFFVFAAQNPHHQGGGRKGLPASFVNRFTVVYTEPFTADDLLVICRQLYPMFPITETKELIRVVTDLGAMAHRAQGINTHGGPWEFNLRDLLRWLHLLSSQELLMPAGRPHDFYNILFLQRFRTSEDLAAVSTQLTLPSQSPNPSHSFFHNLSALSYQVGLGLVARQETSSVLAQNHDYLNPGLDLALLESMLLCVQYCWPCLLVGSSGSGKSRLIRHLAANVGADLVEFPLSSDMDTMDLVGGYEQVDVNRNLSKLVIELKNFLEKAIVQALVSSVILQDTMAILEQINTSNLQDPRALLILLYKLRDASVLPEGCSLIEGCRALVDRVGQGNEVHFEWVDGILVQALKHGSWLVLDNANLCGSSVLDRLNSLLEPNGVLAVNEHRSEDGSAEVVKPHSNFRLFLTMDPRHGELSRAMRNRCIELFVPLSTDVARLRTTRSSYRSSVFRYQPLQNISWNSLDEASIGILAAVCFDHLAYSDFHLYQRWYKQAAIGLLDIDRYKLQVFSSIYEAYSRLFHQDNDVVTSILALYQSLMSKRSLPKDFGNVQSIHPLNNQVLLRLTDEGQPLAQAMWLASLTETMVELELLGCHLNTIRLSITHKPVSQFSRLERSLASVNTLAFSKDSTQPLAGFLESMRCGLSAWIQRQARGILSDQSNTNATQVIARYIRDVLTFTQQPHFDEGTFQVYLTLGRSLAARCHISKDLRDIGVFLDLQLGVFNNSWSLSTGTSLEMLWKVLKPTTAKSLAQLDLILQTEKLMDRFDSLVWRSGASIESLVSLRKSIASVYMQLDPIGDDKDSIFESMENALEKVESQVINVPQEMYPYFREEFEGLGQYFCVSPHGFQELILLDLLAGRSSKQVLDLDCNPAAYGLFTLITRFTGIDQPSNSLVTIRGVFPILSLQKMAKIASVPLRSLDLLCQEVRLLAKGTGYASSLLSENQYLTLNGYLSDLYAAVIRAHEAFLQPQSIKACLKYLESHPYSASQDRVEVPMPSFKSSASRSQFQDIIEQYLDPCLRQIHQEAKMNSRDAASSATAWIKFSTGCLLLYVPDRQYDPALRSKVECDRYDRRNKELKSKLKGLESYEEMFNGQRTSFRCDLIEKELQALGDRPQISMIVRPKISELDQLQGEFINILNSIVARSPITASVELISRGDAAVTQEVELVRQNIKQAVLRLSGSYRAYDDITKPVIGFLHCLDVGLALALMACSSSPPQDSANFIYSITPLLGLEPRGLAQMASDRVKNIPELSHEDRFTYLKQATLIRSIDSVFSQEVRNNTLEIFHTFYEAWKRRLATDQNDYAAKSSIYRYRGDQTQDDEANEDDFFEIFPDYDATSRPAKVAKEHPDADPQRLAINLADYQYELLNGARAPSQQLTIMVEEATNRIAEGWRDTTGLSSCSIPPEDLLPGVILALDSTSESLLSPSGPVGSYNFYVDPNLIEARRLVVLLKMIQARFRDLKEVWPEYATLDDVLRVSNELLAFRHVEPLAKLLTKTEQLHGFIYEWQIVASREYSAVRVYEDITSLIVEWRRIELSTWAQLLDMEDDKCKEDAKSWWFVAYEAIIAAPLCIVTSSEDLTGHVTDLFTTLSEFLYTTSIGQYSQRLILIKQFKNHLELLMDHVPGMQIVHVALVNFLRFYTRFEPGIQETLSKGRHGLEKDMKEVLLLASWKDTNINALRESAKRSHHKLFKIIRKYRALLAQPSENNLKSGSPQWLKRTAASLLAEKPKAVNVDPKILQICKEYVPGWTQKPIRFTDPQMTAANMVRISRLPNSAINCTLYIESFTENLTDAIRVLQKETPLTLTKENSNVVKHLKSRKRKLFADTLKELRMMGFKSNLGADILNRQASLAMVLANTPIFPKGRADFRDGMDLAEFYLDQTLDNLTVIRESARQPSNDLSNAEVSRSLGYLESVLFVTLRQRTLLSGFLADLDGFEVPLRAIHTLWAPEKYVIQKLKQQDVSLAKAVNQNVRWLPSILDASCKIIKTHNKMRDIDSSIVLDELCSWKDRFNALNEAFESIPTLPLALCTSSQSEITETAIECLKQLAASLRRNIAHNPAIGFILEKLSLWAIPDIPSPRRETNGVHSIDLTLFDQKLTTAVDSMLVGVQNMEDALSCIPSSNDEVSWLLNVETSIAKSIKTLQTHSLSDSLEKLLAQLQHLGFTNGHELMTGVALCSSISPVIQQYRNTLRDAVGRYAELHRSFCKMVSKLTTSFREIIMHGFCSPLEKSAMEDSRTEKLEGGTGLGEGEGAEDISKDIQDNEDLSELAQEGTKEKNTEDVDKQDNAINMQLDEMEGEIGNGSEKGEDDNSDSHGSDAENEIDEETGAVDDLDPSAVDEKLWNTNGEDVEKEKKSDQSKGKKEEEITAQDGSQNDTQTENRGDDEEVNETGAEEGEEVVQEEVDKMDPHLQEGRNLELPEEMELDGDKDSVLASDSEGMEDMSDVGQDNPDNYDLEASDSESQDHGALGETLEKLLEELGDENDEDADKTEDAGSPVDTEPEDQDQTDDQGILRDRMDDVTNDADNTAQSEVQGIGEGVNQEHEVQETRNNGAQGDQGQDTNSAENNLPQSAAESGEPSQAADSSGGVEGRDDQMQDSSESQAFKKLGDALENWHRQRQRIRNADTEKPSQENPIETNAPSQEFEHLPDEDTKADTQALGAATEDQARTLDSRALDSDMLDPPQHFLPDNGLQPETGDSEHGMESIESSVADQSNLLEQPKPGAVIGSGLQDSKSHQSNGLQTLDEDDIEDLDNDLSTVHLGNQDQDVPRPAEDARRLWAHYETITRDLSLSLTEQLRLILAPTLATKMRGDFRTGKRLNIKRVIPYVASQYKRDKIWMRRSVPSKRNYQIMLAVDDSKSMSESGSGQLAFETLALVSKSLSMLEVGQVCIVGFGNEVRIAHQFDQPFSSDAGVKVFQHFGFQQKQTNVRKLIAESINLFREARSRTVNTAVDLWQLELIISDGVCEDHESIRRLVRQAQEERIMIVFVIVDALRGESIMDMTQATFEPDAGGETKLKIRRYLDGFPFGYYLIVGNVKELPGVLAAALRQWFAEVVESG